MSYDIHFIPKSADQSWDDALEAMEARAEVDTTLSARSLEQFGTLVAAIAGEDEDYGTDRTDMAWELTHATRPLTVFLSEQEVTLSVPLGEHGGGHAQGAGAASDDAGHADREAHRSGGLRPAARPCLPGGRRGGRGRRGAGAGAEPGGAGG